MEKTQVTLIIENAESALQILLLINKYARVFVAQPIHVLIRQHESDKESIAKVAKRYSIKNIPALISASGKVFTGATEICRRIPLLAREINEGRGEVQRKPAIDTDPEALVREHIEAAVRESPEEDVYDDDAPRQTQSFEEKREAYLRKTQPPPRPRSQAQAQTRTLAAVAATSASAEAPVTRAAAPPKSACTRASKGSSIDDKFEEAFLASQECDTS